MARRRLITAIPLVVLAAAGVAVSLVHFPDVLFSLVGYPDPAVALTSENPELRRAAARELARRGEAGADAIPTIESALTRETDSDTRWLCVYALTRMGSGAGPTLDRVALGAKADPAARLAVSCRPFPTDPSELVRLLAHPNNGVKGEARARLLADPRAARAAVPELVVVCRTQAEPALAPRPPVPDQPPPEPGSIGAIPQELFLPADPSFEPDAVLVEFGVEAIPGVIAAAAAALPDRSPAAGRFRAKLYYVLQRIAVPTAETGKLLATAVKDDPDDGARKMAEWARPRLDAGMIPELIRAIDAAPTRTAALEPLDGLISHGRAASAGVPAVARMMNRTPDGWERWNAAVALARIGPPDQAVTLLTAALASPEPSQAAEALGKLGPAAGAAVPALLAAERRPGVSAHAAASIRRALVRITPPGPDALADRLDPVTDPDDGPANALIELGPEAVPAVVRVLTTGPPAARQRAALVLGRIRPVTDETVAALSAALADPDPDRRAEAAWALAAMGRDAAAAAPALLRAADAAGSRDRASTFRDAARLTDPAAVAAAPADPGRAYTLAAVWAGLALAAGAWVWFRRRAARPVHPVPVAAR